MFTGTKIIVQFEWKTLVKQIVSVIFKKSNEIKDEFLLVFSLNSTVIYYDNGRKETRKNIVSHIIWFKTGFCIGFKIKIDYHQKGKKHILLCYRIRCVTVYRTERKTSFTNSSAKRNMHSSITSLVYLDYTFQWPQEGLNCESPAYEVMAL